MRSILYYIRTIFKAHKVGLDVLLERERNKLECLKGQHEYRIKDIYFKAYYKALDNLYQAEGLPLPHPPIELDTRCIHCHEIAEFNIEELALNDTQVEYDGSYEKCDKEELSYLLRMYIESEDYEDAARIRDEIKKRNQ